MDDDPGSSASERRDSCDERRARDRHEDPAIMTNDQVIGMLILIIGAFLSGIYVGQSMRE